MGDNTYYLGKLETNGYKSHNPDEPLYKYTKADIFKEILKNNTLKFSNPSTFNDPFEFSDYCFNYNLDGSDLNDIMINFAETAGAVNEARYLRSNPISLLTKDDIIKMYREEIERQRSIALVFCTSISPEIPLMWAHYSQEHTGICFGIKMPNDSEKEMK